MFVAWLSVVSRSVLKSVVNVPTFEFIELPGIQSLPEEDRIQSERLVHSYISDPKALVLCVVEGADAVLDKRNALKVVIDANKLGSTTGALTKSDKLSSTASIWTSPLEEAADKELQVFAQMLHDADKAAAMQRQLGRSMTSKQLIVMPNKLYHAHTTGTWVDETLTLIAGEVDSACLCREVSQAVLEVVGNQTPSREPVFNAFWTHETMAAPQMLQWAEHTIGVEGANWRSVSAALQSSRYFEVVRTAFDHVGHCAPPASSHIPGHAAWRIV
ncbi:hypothetical protein WJX77_005411 [Trebouxia sp. C0004]